MIRTWHWRTVIWASFIASEKKFELFLDFGPANGLETNKESAPYTKIAPVKLHETLHLFVAEWSIRKFAVEALKLNRNSLPLSSQRSF